MSARLACGTARRLLWPDAGPQALTPEREPAEAHLAICDACRRFMAEMRASATATRAGAPTPPAPVEVRERLFTALARERARLDAPARPPRRRALGWAVAALAVGGAAVWTATVRPPTSGQDLTPFAEDHVRALQGEALNTADPMAVETWLRARVPFAVHVPRIPGAALEGARLCLLGGRRGAVVRFRLDGEPVSYYVMAERTGGGGTGGADRLDAAAFREETDAGYNVVAWRRDGLVYAVVGALPRERLAALARICTEQLAAAPPRTERVR